MESNSLKCVLKKARACSLGSCDWRYRKWRATFYPIFTFAFLNMQLFLDPLRDC